jgi:hypothetical protein
MNALLDLSEAVESQSDLATEAEAFFMMLTDHPEISSFGQFAATFLQNFHVFR